MDSNNMAGFDVDCVGIYMGGYERGSRMKPDRNEIATIEIPIYRDKTGKHVCARDSKHICPYLGIGDFGTKDYCLLGEARQLGYWNDDASGYIKPICKLARISI